MDDEVYKKSEEYWNENRFENLSKDELGVYKMLDTLQTSLSNYTVWFLF
jgi:hypothetical protein